MSIFQGVAGFFGGEGPVDFGCDGVSVGLPNQGLFFELLGAAQAPVQAVPGKGGEFDFGPVEPEPVFGGEVKFELMAQLPGSVNGQVLVKSAVRVGAAMVLHELNGGHVRVMGGDYPVHKLSVIGLGFSGGDAQMALTRIDIIGQQHVANALAQVLLMFFAGRPRFGRNRGEHMVEQLAGPLVEAQAA